MEECVRIERIVRTWEEQGTLAPSDHEQIQAHCATCPACSRRFSMLLAFLERDARGTPVSAIDEPRAGFTEKVMWRIGTAAPRRAFPPVSWVAIAAACLLLFAGIGFAVHWLRNGQPAGEVVVRFELAAPGARSVALVGSFTGWDTTKFPMTDANGDGVWEITVRLKKDSINIYNFVIDGNRWIPDPNAPALVDDGFGGHNSVMRL